VQSMINQMLIIQLINLFNADDHLLDLSRTAVDQMLLVGYQK